MVTSFKAIKWKLFVVILALMIAVAAGISVAVYFQVGFPHHSDGLNKSMEEKLAIGSSFTVGDIVDSEEFQAAWLSQAGNVVEVYLTVLNENGTEQSILSQDVLSYDAATRSFQVVGIGAGEIYVYSGLDSSVNARFPYNTYFASADTWDWVAQNYPDLTADGALLQAELSLVELLTLEQPSLNFVDLPYFTNLKRIALGDVDGALPTVQHLQNAQGIALYVPYGAYDSYLADKTWGSLASQILPNANPALSNVTAVFTLNEGDTRYIRTIPLGSCVNLDSVAITRTGYTFLGWFFSANGGQTLGAKLDADYVFNDDAKLYAAWSVNHYTVRYDTNHGSGAFGEHHLAYGESFEVASIAPTRTGYTFLGWALTGSATNGEFSGGQTLQNLSQVDGDTVVLFAVWTPRSYIISYDARGGENAPTSQNAVYDTAMRLSEAEPSRTGYVFEGWQYGDKVYLPADLVKNLTTAQGATVVLMAKWNAITYTVQYNALGGDKTPEPQTLTYDIEDALSDIVPSLYGFTFGGWKHGDTTYAAGASVLNLSVTEGDTITLTAVWYAIDYTVVFDANGGGGAPPSQTTTYGVNIQISDTEPSRTGYTFLGWAKTPTALDAEYLGGTELASEIICAFANEQTATLTLYAVWASNIYEVRYDANGGINPPQTLQGCRFGEPITLAKGEISREGYVFLGWSLVRQTQPCESLASVGGYPVQVEIAGGLNSTNDEFVVVYAVWYAARYNIVYNAPNASNVPPTQTGILYDVGTHLSSQIPTRHGYIFGGWKIGSSIYQPNDVVVNLVDKNGSEAILTPIWTPIRYSIAYNPDGGAPTPPSIPDIGFEDSITLSGAIAKTGYLFEGWYVEGTALYSAGESVSKLTGENEAVLTLSPKWVPITYTIRYNAGTGGTNAPSDQTATYDKSIVLSSAHPSKTGYHFTGWKFGNETYPSSTSVVNLTTEHNAVVTLTAEYNPNAYTVKYDLNGGSGTFNDQSATYDKKFNLRGIPSRSGYDFDGWQYNSKTYSGGQEVSNLTTTNGGSVTMKALWSESGGTCVATGTLITLADGTQKAVEELDGSEMLLIWNLFTGSFDVAPMIFVFSKLDEDFTIARLQFSDGTVVNVIGEHGFWSIDQNRYVYIRSSNAVDYIGQWFYKLSGSEQLSHTAVQLVSVTMDTERTGAWSPVTYKHFAFYVDGLLSVPGDTAIFTGIFAVDASTMRYDQAAMEADIAQYGLFTYEEFYEIVPISQEVFEAFNGAYLKVSIGKGELDYAVILELVAMFGIYL